MDWSCRAYGSWSPTPRLLNGDEAIGELVTALTREKAQWAASVKEAAHCVSCAVRDSNPGPAD